MLLGKLKAYIRGKSNKFKIVFIDNDGAIEVGRVSKGMLKSGELWSKKEAQYEEMEYEENCIVLHRKGK
jgi:hypothetical protein